MDEILSELFIAARGPWNSKPVIVDDKLNMMQLGHFSADHRSFEELQGEIEKNASSGGWSLYMIHDVGVEKDELHINKEEHENLIRWLADNRSSIWVAPVLSIAKYVKDYLQK